MISKKDGNLEIGEFLELQYNVFFFIYLILEFFFVFEIVLNNNDIY